MDEEEYFCEHCGVDGELLPVGEDECYLCAYEEENYYVHNTED